MRIPMTGFGIMVLLALALLNVAGVTAESAQVTASGTISGEVTVIIFDLNPPAPANLDSENGNRNLISQSNNTESGDNFNLVGKIIEVRSNVWWNATASTTAPSGSVKVVEGTQPTSYAECDRGVSVTSEPSIWKKGVTPGIHIYNVYYCIGGNRDEGPATFNPEITYRVTQL